MAAKTGTYTLIASNTLGSAQSSVTFSSIPGTYTDLVLVCSVKATTGTPVMQIAINSDSGSNYSRTGLYGDGSTATSFRLSSQTILGIFSADATNFTPAIIQFNDYSNTTTYKTILSRSGITYPAAQVGLWRSTSAITSIVASTDSSTFTSGSTFKLYGIEAGNL
jgi:hypothetical protein